MYDKEFSELVKVAVEKLKEDTVYEMIKQSEGYQEESVARALAEQRYGELDLTKEQSKKRSRLGDAIPDRLFIVDLCIGYL